MPEKRHEGENVRNGAKWMHVAREKITIKSCNLQIMSVPRFAQSKLSIRMEK
jgi:hypothetical protein